MHVNSAMDNAALQNMRFGDRLRDAAKAAGHGALDSLYGSFLQQLEGAPVKIYDHGKLIASFDHGLPLQNMQFCEIICPAVAAGVAGSLAGKAVDAIHGRRHHLQNLQFGGATDAEVGYVLMI